MVRRVEELRLGGVLDPGIVPKMTGGHGPGAIRWTGPEVGAQTEKILLGYLGLSAEEIAALREDGMV